MAVIAEIGWRGTEEEQRVARSVYELLVATGRFRADDAPLRQSLNNLQAYFASQPSLRLRDNPEELGRLIEQSLTANQDVFAREETEAGISFVTTKRGTPPGDTSGITANLHSFRTRLFEGAREPTDEDLKAVRGVAREIPEIIMTVPEPVHAVFPDELSDPFEPEYEPDAEPVQPELAAPAPVDRRVLVGGAVVDLADDPASIVEEHGGQFRELLGRYLDEDFRFVRFGDDYYVEDRLERLSKGQLRDIKEYITERNEPLSDEELLSDALRRPLQNADYSLWRFTINYRLSREKKDFRFVGTAQDRLWATTSLPPIGQSYRKASELAQDYRYLTDPELADNDLVTPASGSDVSGRLEMRHVLTWYESENGVLPVGRSTQLLMPDPLLEDQTVVVLRIQDPQNYATYLAELRIGASNRGTYIAGLEELFQNTLVPGAVFSLVQGAGSNEFTLEYPRQSAQESRLLQWDPRRERWFFGPVVYECPVEPSYLLSEERVGQLSGRKRASDAERRRPEVLLQGAFELVGERGGDGSFTALIDDLRPVMNIDRPFSREYIESIVSSAQYPQFALQDPAIGLAEYRPE
jgi:hypothetical protein